MLVIVRTVQVEPGDKEEAIIDGVLKDHPLCVVREEINCHSLQPKPASA